MSDTNKNQVVEEVKEQEVEQDVDLVVDKPEEDKPEEISYTKRRVIRATQQKENEIIKTLGVESIEDAKSIIDSARNSEIKALEEVQKLKKQLEQKETEQLNTNKYRAIVGLLEKHNVFDAEALANYVDLSVVKYEDGELVDSDGIVESLKKAKPKFFATIIKDGDHYIKGDTTVKVKTAQDYQQEGNDISAINSYLKSIKL